MSYNHFKAKGRLKMSYHYPIEYDWNKEEIVAVIHFYSCIEKAYEESIQSEEVLIAYSKLKKIIPSKSEEKHSFKEFAERSGYTPYKVIKLAQEKKIGKIKL